ncbi:uncharacterized protein ACRADG_006476 isoform 1-T5 [Cochliomyia hominivorax]
MKLKDIGDLLVFDTLPLMYEPKQKIILTHLLHLEEQTFPPQLPMIFTTLKLANQLKRYCEVNKYRCLNKSNLIVVKPYEFIDIILERRLTLQILFCASEEDELNNVMVLIKENGKLNYIYAGNFTDIRSALMNDIFASWISNGVEKLYVNLKRIEENHNFNDIEQIEKVFNHIKDIMKCHNDSRINIHLPLFGYEHFILKLAKRFPMRIKYANLQQFYLSFNGDESQIETYFIKDSNTNERIKLIPEESTPYRAKILFKETKEITINIRNEAINCENNELYNQHGYYELFYSPEPSPFQLKLLCMLVKPKRIFGIVDTFNNKSKVPKYLIELCEGAKERQKKIEEKKLSDPFRLTEVNKKHPPTTIIGGAALNKLGKQTGPFLSDSESEDSS